MRIHFIQPFATDKNIGRAYNQACREIPQDDWICITDHDSCFLHPYSPKQLYDVVQTTGRHFDLLGCVTNRLNSGNQCYAGIRSEDPDIMHHKAIADMLYDEKYDAVRRVNFTIAGLLLLFPRATWDRAKFAEYSPRFDVHFSNDILRTGGKLGLMEGVYRFHYYRMGVENPGADFSHLKMKL